MRAVMRRLLFEVGGGECERARLTLDAAALSKLDVAASTASASAPPPFDDSTVASDFREKPR